MIKIKEEGEGAVPTNSAGAGGIDGIGVGPRGEPGFPKKKLRNILKRKSPGGPAIVPGS